MTPARWATLRLIVRDGLTKEKVPARIHVKRADGSCFLPPVGVSDRFTGRAAPPYILPRHFKKNLHLCKAIDLQSIHLTSGDVAFPVPAGKLRLFVSRGHEVRPVVRTFEARAGETVALEVVLDSIASMPRLGWHNADMHVHFSRFTAQDDRILAHLLAAEDLHAINNMVYKHDGRVEAPQRKMGHRHTHFDLFHSHQVVAGGEEFRDDDLYGHMIAAGISKVIEPISVGRKLGRTENYPLFTEVCDRARGQGGIAGWAHGACIIKLGESLPVEAALGKLDFVESIQFNNFGGFYFWYRLLNCGLRLAITGGSDFPFGADTLGPWYPNLGRERTYSETGTEDPFTYERYIDGIRRGRTFATNGPLIFLEVEGRRPGGEIRLPRGGRRGVRIAARAVAAYPLSRLEIVANGAVVLAVDGKGGAREIAVETRLRLPDSAWVAARVRGRVEPADFGGTAPWNLHAHTSPVYVLRGGRPIREPADATFMADYVRWISERYRKYGFFKAEAHRRALFENLRRAEVFYQEMLP